jgi:rubrerythrin
MGGVSSSGKDMAMINETENIYSFQRRKSPKPDFSPFEMMLSQFEAHEQQEWVYVREYKEIAKKHDNPLVKFLLQLIISDEEKHHDLVHSITSTLKADLRWEKSDVAIQGVGKISAQEKKDILKLTGDFIDEEKKGIKEYKILAKDSREYHHGVLSLLLETIIHDSEKHLKILRFIEKKIGES